MDMTALLHIDAISGDIFRAETIAVGEIRAGQFQTVTHLSSNTPMTAAMRRRSSQCPDGLLRHRRFQSAPAGLFDHELQPRLVGWPLGPLVNYQPLAFGSAASLSQIDIAALHNMYGAKTTGAGDTICSLTAAYGGYTT